MFVQGSKHSENSYLIHNMNSICRLCKLIISIFPPNTHNRLVVSSEYLLNELSKRNWVVNHCHLIDGDF